MPILEAMIHGCPVIAAPLPPLPEVGGSAADYADADDPEAWRVAMENIALDDDERDARVLAGRMHAGMFTWRRTAEAHLALYETLI